MPKVLRACSSQVSLTHGCQSKRRGYWNSEHVSTKRRREVGEPRGEKKTPTTRLPEHWGREGPEHEGEAGGSTDSTVLQVCLLVAIVTWGTLNKSTRPQRPAQGQRDPGSKGGTEAGAVSQEGTSEGSHPCGTSPAPGIKVPLGCLMGNEEQQYHSIHPLTPPSSTHQQSGNHALSGCWL